MSLLTAYRQQAAAGWTRIDLLLALYDGAIERLGRARELLRAGDADSARLLVTRARLIVCSLAAGVDLQQGDPEPARNVLRLYDFVAHNLLEPTPESLEGALAVLNTLREAFQGIRDEAIQMERRGLIGSVESQRAVMTVV